MPSRNIALLFILCALSSAFADSGEDTSNRSTNIDDGDDMAFDFLSSAEHGAGGSLLDAADAAEIEDFLLMNINSQELTAEIREIVIKAYEDAREMRKHARVEADKMVRAARLSADKIRETATEEARRVVDMIITEGRRYEAEERLLMEGEREFHQAQIAELKVEQALAEASLQKVRNSLTSRQTFIRLLEAYGVATTLVLLYVFYLARRQAVDLLGQFEAPISYLRSVGNSLKAKALRRSQPTAEARPAAAAAVAATAAAAAEKVEPPLQQSGHVRDSKRETLTRSWNATMSSSKLANSGATGTGIGSGGLKLSKSASSNMDSMFDSIISPIEVKKKL